MIKEFLVSFLILTGSLNSMQAQSTARDNFSPIVYEIFIQSFCDSNGDGIGDLNGIYSKLDYLRDLGVTTIWLTPFHPSPSYHKYDVVDYRAVHPDYGTMADLQKLIFGVHQRNMKIMMDLVINHTSSDHPWFKISASSPDNPHREYYVWKKYDDVKDELEKKKTTFDSDNITQWHAWEGQDERYYGFFWKGMPDLNFDNPVIRQEVYDIVRFWIDKGFDGFRLDAAKHIYPDDRLEDTKAFWGEFRNEVEKYKPDVELVGEVWAEPEVLAHLFPSLPALFNFELSKSIRESIQQKNAAPLINTIKEIQSVYPVLDTTLRDAILLSNHDMNRIASELGGNAGQVKLAASILLSYPGTPYIYYGEEIGMLGKKPDEGLREPFLWDASVWDSTWWHPIEHSIQSAVTPLDVQRNNETSIYHHYKTWIKWRKELGLSDARITSVQNPYPGVIKMDLLTRDKENVRIFHNLNDSFVVIPLNIGPKEIMPSHISAKIGEIRLEGFQSGILRL